MEKKLDSRGRVMKVVPLGERQRLRILAVLAEEAMSAADIGDRIHLSKDMVLKHLKAMREESPRRIHVGSYTINGTGRPTPLYAIGNEPDAEYHHQTVLKSHHHRLLGIVLAELEQSPRTIRELSILTKLSISGARNLVSELREMGWCYLSAWAPPVNRNRAPIFSVGIGKDAPPAVTTRAKRWKQEKADPDLHKRNLAKRRTKALAARTLKKPQGVFAALFA